MNISGDFSDLKSSDEDKGNNKSGYNSPLLKRKKKTATLKEESISPSLRKKSQFDASATNKFPDIGAPDKKSIQARNLS